MDQVILNSSDFSAWETRYRAEFFNALNGFKSIVLVGSQSTTGHKNLSIFSSIFHLGSKPACFGMIFRPDSVERHTLDNIRETGFYTFNHITKKFYKAAHQTSAKYPREVSEFDACGFEKEYADGFFAPFVKESSVKIGLKKVEEQMIHFNKTILVVGEIVTVNIPKSIIAQDGYIDLNQAGTLTLSGTNSYHKTHFLERLPYAKP